MLITIICLLQLFSHLQPARGETTELLESVGKQTPKGSYDEIVCRFNVQVSLSRVDFVDTTGSHVFAIVDCGSSCNVRSSYQDVLRIVSPQNTISGDYFVFNASRSEKTTGSYTCHGIPIPQVASPTPPGTGDGEENQKISPTPQTDEASHEGGGSSNGLLAVLIIPILLVLIGVVLFLHWRGVIQIPGLRATRDRQQPCDPISTLRNLLEPVTRCRTRTRPHSQSIHGDHETSKHPLPNKGKEAGRLEHETTLEVYENEHSAESPLLSRDESTGIRGRQALRPDSSNSIETKDENGVKEHHVSSNSSLSTNSMEDKNENGVVEEGQSLAGPPATSLSPEVIQCKDESAANAPGSPPRGTEVSKEEQPAAPPRSVQTNGYVSQTISKIEQNIKQQSNTERNKEDMKKKEEREGERAEMKESRVAKLETENNENTRWKQERREETMAAKAEREHQEEAGMKMENTEELNTVAEKEQSKDTTTETKEEMAARVDKQEDNYNDQSSSGAADDVDNVVGTSLSHTGAASADVTQEVSENKEIIKRLNSGLSDIVNLYATHGDGVNE